MKKRMIVLVLALVMIILILVSCNTGPDGTATDTPAGADEEKCAACGTMETVKTEEEIVSASCEMDGSYAEVIRCAGCDVEISRTVVTVPKTGHSPEYVVFSGADCTKQWHTGEKCALCEKVLTSTSEKKGSHTMVDGECTYCHMPQSSEGLVFTQKSGGYKLTGRGTCTETDIVIGVYEGKSVTEIDVAVFQTDESIASFTLGASVLDYKSVDGVIYSEGGGTLVRYPAASARDSFSFPDNVREILPYAFYGCSNLSAVSLPQGLTVIGDSAFLNCKSLTEIDLSSVSKVDTNAFSGCVSLASADLSNARQLERSAFWGCKSLVSVTLSEGLTKLETGAFANCSSLTQIYIPASVGYLGLLVFDGCDSMTAFTVADGNKILKSVDGVLYSKNGEKLHKYPAKAAADTFTVPNGVERIESGAFEGAENLVSVMVPNSVLFLGSGAFKNCVALTSISVPPCTVYEDSFDGCKSLEIISGRWPVVAWNNTMKNFSNWAAIAQHYTIRCTDGDIVRED